jgi:hypothetical protein
VRRGEVWWAEHPEWGRRPALVMTRDEAIDSLNGMRRVRSAAQLESKPVAHPQPAGFAAGDLCPCIDGVVERFADGLLSRTMPMSHTRAIAGGSVWMISTA